MKGIMHYGASLLLALALCLFNSPSWAQENHVRFLEKERIKELNNGIYEVVTPKLESSKITYDRPLPFDKLDFKERNEKYLSIGTAFFISEKELMTAGHVFSPMYFSLSKKYFIRDGNGKVYPVANVHKYSTVRDMLVFDLEEYPAQVRPLTFCRQLEVGDTVFSAGNALGDGVAYRAGQVASFTDERAYGQWKDIRFSSPTSPGNSGGPLLNIKGEVTGVIVKRASAGENYNIAVPISELDNVGSTAEFHLRNLRAEILGTDEHILRDWSFSLPLPVPLSEVCEKAQASLNALYKQLDADLLEKVQDKNFPKGERFRHYLRRQDDDSKGAVSIIPNSSFSAWKAAIYTMEKLPVAPGQNVYSKGELPDGLGGPYGHIRTIIEKPAGSLKEFLGSPKAIMDTWLKAEPAYRYLGDERVRITSLGVPEKTETWQDRLGRTWTGSLWYAEYDNSFIYARCLPYPKGALCIADMQPASTLTRNYFERSKRHCDMVAVGYEGGLDDWAEYIALGKEQLPAFFQNAEIVREGSRLKIRMQDFRFDFTHPKIDGASELHLHMGFANDTLLAEDLVCLDVLPQKGNPNQYTVQPLFEPSPFGDESYTAAWKDSLQSEGKFSGKPYTAGEMQVVLKAVPKTRKTLSAFDGQKVEKMFVVGCTYNVGAQDGIEEDCGRFAQKVEFF